MVYKAYDRLLISFIYEFSLQNNMPATRGIKTPKPSGLMQFIDTFGLFKRDPIRKEARLQMKVRRLMNREASILKKKQDLCETVRKRPEQIGIEGSRILRIIQKNMNIFLFHELFY